MRTRPALQLPLRLRRHGAPPIAVLAGGRPILRLASSSGHSRARPQPQHLELKRPLRRVCRWHMATDMRMDKRRKEALVLTAVGSYLSRP